MSSPGDLATAVFIPQGMTGPGKWIVGILVFFSGLFFLQCLRALFRIAASRYWPAVEGTVIQSEMVERRSRRGPQFFPVIVYEYSVEGQRYTSSVITLGAGVEGGGDSGRQLVAEYPLGRVLPVYFKPGDPKLACLERGEGTSSTLLGMAIAAALFSVGLWLLLRP